MRHGGVGMDIYQAGSCSRRLQWFDTRDTLCCRAIGMRKESWERARDVRGLGGGARCSRVVNPGWLNKINDDKLIMTKAIRQKALEKNAGKPYP